MDTRDHRAARAGRAPAWHAVVGCSAAALLLATLVSGCGSQPTPSPTPTATPTPTAAPAPTPTPIAYADTLRIGVYVGFYRGWQTAFEFDGVPALTFGRLVYSTLYRYDGRDSPVPDLADGECFVPGSDGRVLRCRLIETTFHDGTPLTADDVAYSYRILQRRVPGNRDGLTPNLKEVRVVDPRTVDFVLGSVDPTFLTGVLPIVLILPRHAVEAASADLMTRLATAGLTANDYAELSDTIRALIDAEPPVCSEARVARIDAIYAALDVHSYREDFVRANGTFDRCAYLGGAAGDFTVLAYILSHTGDDRLGAALVWNAYYHPPSGTGPYRYVSQDADSVHFEAFAGYHGGLAATRYVDFVRAKGDGSDFDAGTVDILPGGRCGQGCPFGPGYQAAAPAHGVLVVTPPTAGFYALTFNVREGRLFSDVNLRKALQLCIDLPRAVDAATGGAGTPIYGPIIPGSWFDDPDLPKPDRDTAAAKRLIEASGWTLGADGVYAKGKLSLAAVIPVRNVAERIKMADLIAAQARDCGMDLRGLPLEDYGNLLTYPHYIPGTKTPFDLLLSGWMKNPDPDMASIYASSEITDAKRPEAFNVGGFSDPAFDGLIAGGMETYDQVERTRIYHRAQEELASQVPAVFLWANYYYDALRTAVTTADGPLDLSVPNWAWQPERLVVVSNP